VGGVAMSPVLPATQQEELSSLVVAAEGGHVVRCQVSAGENSLDAFIGVIELKS
jgi:hypothetical protein